MDTDCVAAVHTCDFHFTPEMRLNWPPIVRGYACRSECLYDIRCSLQAGYDGVEQLQGLLCYELMKVSALWAKYEVVATMLIIFVLQP